MKILKLLPLSMALLLGGAIVAAPPASADTFCSSFGIYSTCVEVPGYTNPVPPPPKPLPVWVCKTVFTTQLVFSVIPGPIPTFISSVLVIPTVHCFWN